MLVVVEHGDVQALFEFALHLKAAGRANVLQVDAPKGAGNQLDGVDNLIHVLGADAKREGVNPGKGLEQGALALHHRHARLGADVPQAQHGGAVGDNGHQIPTAGVLIGFVHVLLNLQARGGHAGGVGHGQVLLVLQHAGGVHTDFPLPLAVHLQSFLRVIHSKSLPFAFHSTHDYSTASPPAQAGALIFPPALRIIEVRFFPQEATHGTEHPAL